jgi:hypothetical protein
MCVGRLIFSLNVHCAFVLEYIRKYEGGYCFPLFVIRPANDVTYTRMLQIEVINYFNTGLSDSKHSHTSLPSVAQVWNSCWTCPSFNDCRPKFDR